VQRTLGVWAIALGAMALMGCGANLTNTATVYPLISGGIEVRWKLSVSGIQEVDYTVDDQIAGTSTTNTNEFAVQFDTHKFVNGLHVLRAVALDGNHQTIQTVQHALLIQN
jgi:hypothetical protein